MERSTNNMTEDGSTTGAIPVEKLDFHHFGRQRPNSYRGTNAMALHWQAVIAQMEKNPGLWVRVLVAKDGTQRPATLKKDRRIRYSSVRRDDGLFDIYACLKAK